MTDDINKVIELAQATYNGSIIKLAEEIASILEDAYRRLGYLEKAEPVNKVCNCDSCIDKDVAKKAKPRTTQKAKTDEPTVSVPEVQKRVLGKSKSNKM